MRTAGPKTYFVALITLLGTMSDGVAEEWLPVAQWVFLDPIEWELTTKFDGTWKQSVRAGQTSREREIETGLLLRQRGAVLDDRIARFVVEVEPVTSKGRFTAASQTDDRDGDFLNYSGSLSLLHGTPGPFSYNAHAARSSGTTTGSLGSRTEFTSETRGVAVNWKTPVFPSTLSYEERLEDSTFTAGLNASTSERDDVLRILKFQGRSRKMDVTLERSSFEDLVEGRDRDFDETRGIATHRFRWGRGSTLDSRLDFFDRTGFNPNRRFTLDEDARIQHTKNVTSDTSYRFESTEQTVTTTTHEASAALTHRLYDSLTSTVRVDGRVTDSDNSAENEYKSELDFAYQKRIPWGGTFSAGVGGSYGVTDRTSSEGLLDITDESHIVPVTLLVPLARRFIDVSTIIVTDSVGVVTYTEGTDYTVVSAVDDLTELSIVSGGGISALDTILVSYRYQPLPTLKYSTREFRSRVGLDFGWISVFHRNSREDESLISGAGESFLIDRRDRATGIELSWDGRPIEARASAETRFSRNGDFETDTLDFSQFLSYNISRTAFLTLSASETFSESKERDTEFYNADLALYWRPLRGLTISPSLGAWARKEQGSSVGGGRTSEQFKTAGLDVRWTWRRIDLSLRYDHNIQQGLNNDQTEDVVVITLIRRSG